MTSVNPHMNATEISDEISKLWKLVTPSEMKIYDTLHDERKTIYNERLLMYQQHGYFFRNDGTKSNELSLKDISRKIEWEILQKETNSRLDKVIEICESSREKLHKDKPHLNGLFEECIHRLHSLKAAVEDTNFK